MPRPAKTPTPPPPGYVWAPEAARRTGLSVKTLYNYRHRGGGPKAVPIGRKLAYPLDEITAYMRQLRTPQADPEREAENRPPEPRTARRRIPQQAAA